MSKVLTVLSIGAILLVGAALVAIQVNGFNNDELDEFGDFNL